MGVSAMESVTDRLRAVFDLCDSERKGYITVDHFIDLAKEHFGASCGNGNDVRTL